MYAFLPIIEKLVKLFRLCRQQMGCKNCETVFFILVIAFFFYIHPSGLFCGHLMDDLKKWFCCWNFSSNKKRSFQISKLMPLPLPTLPNTALMLRKNPLKSLQKPTLMTALIFWFPTAQWFTMQNLMSVLFPTFLWIYEFVSFPKLLTFLFHAACLIFFFHILYGWIIWELFISLGCLNPIQYSNIILSLPTSLPGHVSSIEILDQGSSN